MPGFGELRDLRGQLVEYFINLGESKSLFEFANFETYGKTVDFEENQHKQP